MSERAEIRYKRLPGRGPRKNGRLSSPFSRCRLYVGADHLLSVETGAFSEGYKRFYFNDIQVATTERTNRWIAWALIFVLSAMAATGVGLAVPSDFARLFWFLFATAMLVFLVVDLLKGPSCSCRILTAVQEEQLPSLNRLRTARKVIDGVLRPLIEGSQGRLAMEELAAAHASGRVTRWKVDETVLPLKKSQPQVLSDYQGVFHWIAFSLVMIHGILTAIGLAHSMPFVSAATSVIYFAFVVCAVVALIKQRHSTVAQGVRAATWVTLAFACFSYFLETVVIGVLSSMGTLRTGGAPDTLFRDPTLFQDSTLIFVISIIQAGGDLLAGGIGLVLTIKSRSGLALAEAEPMSEVMYKR